MKTIVFWNSEAEHPQVQASPVNDYIKKAFTFLSIDDMTAKDKKDEFLAKISGQNF